MVPRAVARRPQPAVQRKQARLDARARPVADRVEARLVDLLARVAEAGAVRVDQARIDRLQLGPGEAEALERPRTMVGEEHVGALDQAAQDGARLGRLQVDRQAALAAVVGQEAVLVVVHRHARDVVAAPVQVALDRLELDHLCAVVGERRAHRWHHDHRGRLEHADTRKQACFLRRQRHASTLLWNPQGNAFPQCGASRNPLHSRVRK